jgi:hypothetical protein
MDLSEIWSTAINDIPVLEAFCNDKLKENQTLELTNITSSATTTTDHTS